MAEKHVLLVHGLWMTGHEMGFLARRLGHCGYRPVRFPYPDIRASVAENARRLIQFISEDKLEAVNLVAHSLGGLVVLRALHDFPESPVNRAVLLGTPVAGSAVTRRLASFPPARLFFGKCLEEGLASNARVPGNLANVGMIAGTLPVGFGRLVGGLHGPNDGAVAVQEMTLPGSVHHVCVQTNHFGLLLSREVAKQCCRFLDKGSFLPTVS